MCKHTTVNEGNLFLFITKNGNLYKSNKVNHKCYEINSFFFIFYFLDNLKFVRILEILTVFVFKNSETFSVLCIEYFDYL